MTQRLSGGIRGRVSRRNIALNPIVWRSVAVCFALVGLGTVAMSLFVPAYRGYDVTALGALLVAFGAFLASRPAPEADSKLPHVAVAGVYVGTSIAMFAFAPHGSAALPAAAFTGVVAAVWLDSPRQMFAHFVAATIVLLLPICLGMADTATLLGAIMLIPPTFVLGVCCHTVLTLAEAQGRRLENLAMRDPLTGAGNRRLLDEELEVELERHYGMRRSFTVFALDLDGFKAINDTLGHAAGDRVLRDVATRLVALAGERATVSRLGGDEFVVVAPMTDRDEADVLAERLRTGLGPAISAGVGWATFPHDGLEAETLLDIADARLIARKSSARDDDANEASWVRDVIVPDHVEPTPHHPALERLVRQPISRDVLGSGLILWRITGAMFLFYGCVCLAFIATGPGPGEPLAGASPVPLLIFGVAVSFAILRAQPPKLHTWPSELVISLTYLLPAASYIIGGPHASALAGMGIFVGPFVAVRTRTRLRAGIHIGAALAVSLAVAGSGLVDLASVLALGLLNLFAIVIGVYVVFVLEACEAQGAELERLSALDPLTLLANRRHLLDSLTEHLDDAAAAHRPVAALALDLNGFKQLNDTVGHGAGDLLLIDVARTLREVIGPHALAARPGGDEFTVVLRNQDRAAAHRVAERLRDAISRLRPSGYAISTGIGVALFPDDATTPEALLGAADQRLLADKYGAEPISA